MKVVQETEASMSVGRWDTLDREGAAQLYIAKQALLKIAADHVVTARGDRKRLSREQAILIAREACARLGLDFGGKPVARGGAGQVNHGTRS